jgi:hypothetical protein
VQTLGRLILRYADAGGRPMSNAEFCPADARVRVTRARAVGLKVNDDRNVGPSASDQEKGRAPWEWGAEVLAKSQHSRAEISPDRSFT